MKSIFTESAEKMNGRVAMLGFLLATINYLATGQLIPGVF